jgi:hypothetical protein
MVFIDKIDVFFFKPMIIRPFVVGFELNFEHLQSRKINLIVHFAVDFAIVQVEPFAIFRPGLGQRFPTLHMRLLWHFDNEVVFDPHIFPAPFGMGINYFVIRGCHFSWLAIVMTTLPFLRPVST